MKDDLLGEIKNSIVDMQRQMQHTYANLGDIKLTGHSHDKTVEIAMTATYILEKVKLHDAALNGGIKELEWRLFEAWKDVTEQIQKTTQSKTMELLQGMQVPDEIKNIQIESDDTEKE